MRSARIRAFSALFCALLAAAGQSVSAEAITLSVNGFVQGDEPGSGQAFQTSVDADESGLFSSTATDLGGSIWTADNVAISGDIDPVANLAFDVTNVTGSTIEVVMNLNVPIAPPLAATVFGGTAALTLTNSDASFNGALVENNAAGDPLFVGLIDGVPVLDLLETVSLSTASFDLIGDTEGLPGPTIPGGAALSSIGIEVNFALSPGDSVSFTSSFQVELIPEPSTTLLVVGGLVIAATRRRV